MNTRFEESNRNIDKRFESMDKRLDDNRALMTSMFNALIGKYRIYQEPFSFHSTKNVKPVACQMIATGFLFTPFSKHLNLFYERILSTVISSINLLKMYIQA
ncbi:hypothetical protein MHK_003913 [Candidatus Magnetomorum sp. HK-1]|nr:hypothetical protein MHK_003913 [Candidatus Magnetomorum sp. HK-1]